MTAMEFGKLYGMDIAKFSKTTGVVRSMGGGVVVHLAVRLVVPEQDTQGRSAAVDAHPPICEDRREPRWAVPTAANTVWKAIGDFILRTWESGTSTLVLVAVGVFAAGVLHRADVVKAALLADGHNVWAEVAEPAAWAALLAVSCATLKAVYGGLPAILPKTKLRSMSADASELASRIEDGLYDDRSQWLLVDLLTFRARLAKLGIHAPKVSGDAAGRDAWVRFLIELRIWIRLGDLRSARAYRPPPT